MPLIDNRKIIKNEIDYDKLGQTITNASSSNIDYEKLAEAVVKATQAKEEAENQQREEALRELREKYKVKEEITGKGLRVFAQKALNDLRGSEK